MARKSSHGSSSGLQASEEAKKAACVLLEVLSGDKGPTEAAADLSVSLNRYYALETRALEGFVQALEPRPKGRAAATAESLVASLRRERDRLRVELDRARTLVRMSQRTVGLAQGGKKAGKGRKKKRGSRGRKVLARLRDGEEKGVTPKEAS